MLKTFSLQESFHIKPDILEAVRGRRRLGEGSFEYSNTLTVTESYVNAVSLGQGGLGEWA